MKVNLEHPTGTNNSQTHQTILFGVSDFQVHNRTTTVFFPPNTGLESELEELSLNATVTAAIEENVLDELTYEELLAESITADTVVVVYSNEYPRLPSLVDGLPEEINNSLTVIDTTDSYSELPITSESDTIEKGDTVDGEVSECVRCDSDQLTVLNTEQTTLNELVRDVFCESCSTEYTEEFTIERTTVTALPDK